MVIEFTAPTGPLLWALIPALLIVGLVLFACVEPELAEIYMGDWQLLAATVTLAVVVVVMVYGHTEARTARGASRGAVEGWVETPAPPIGDYLPNSPYLAMPAGAR
jgi:hypothetical protein